MIRSLSSLADQESFPVEGDPKVKGAAISWGVTLHPEAERWQQALSKGPGLPWWLGGQEFQSMQGTWGWIPVREDPTCWGQLSLYTSQLLTPCDLNKFLSSVPREGTVVRNSGTATKSIPAHCSQRSPAGKTRVRAKERITCRYIRALFPYPHRHTST